MLFAVTERSSKTDRLLVIAQYLNTTEAGSERTDTDIDVARFGRPFTMTERAGRSMGE